jgi:hypothetical protein
MSAFAPALNQTRSFFSFDGTSGGASPDADRIPALFRDIVTRFKGSATGDLRIAEPTRNIYDVYERCQRENWNGEYAIPVSRAAVREAERLLLTFPTYIPVPDIFADPTGAIVFEWYRRPKHRLAISIYGNGVLEFAGLLGVGNSVYGEARIGNALPKIIRNHLQDLFSD